MLEFNAEGAAKIAFPEIPHSLMLVLSCLDDAGLRREFDAHVDLEDKGERRMSKAGLAKFMGAKGLAHGETEVELVMKRVGHKRVDTNGDFEIDFLEFKKAPTTENLWVSKDQFYRLFPLPNARDTPIQCLVSQR